MIRRPQHRDEWTDMIDHPSYRGAERRNAIPSDRRTDVYIEQISQPEKKPMNMPLIWQILTTVLSTVGVGVGLYLSNHDDQLKFKYEMTAFQEKYKEDQVAHIMTHDKIFKNIEKLNAQSESIEQTLTQSLIRRSNVR
jgi:hypothetical protein